MPFIIRINPVHCPICSKITTKQELCVSQREPSPINRNNTYGRPAQPNLYCRHEPCMQNPPQQSNEKHPFRPNKQHYSQILSIFHFLSMKSFDPFTYNVTPPKRSNNCQRRKSNEKKCSTSRILMKTQHQRCCQKQQTKPSQSRPRTWIYQMKTMMYSLSTWFTLSGIGHCCFEIFLFLYCKVFCKP